MFGRDDPLFADDGEIAVGDGDGDVTDTEETYTLRCEAAERAEEEGGLDRAASASAAGAASPAVLKELPTSGYVSSFLNNKRNWSAMHLLILYD